jgi:hypothetical protein
VEHLASGSVTHFDSLGRLGDFVAQVLGADPIDNPVTGPSDPATTNPPAELAKENR